MQENCTSGLPSGDWKREGILSVRQPVYAPVVDSTEISGKGKITTNQQPLDQFLKTIHIRRCGSLQRLVKLVGLPAIGINY